MKIEYDGQVYKIDEITAPAYRIYNDTVSIVIWAEWKNGGSYFQIKRVSYKQRTYTAQRYFYKWVPICREATYKIAQENGLWDYTENTLRKLA